MNIYPGRNQKERLRSLELAAGQSAGNGRPQPQPTPPVSEIDQRWLSPMEENSESNVHFPAIDIPNVSVCNSTEDKVHSSIISACHRRYDDHQALVQLQPAVLGLPGQHQGSLAIHALFSQRDLL